MRGAVFDWDGTLVDIDEREFYCINQTLRDYDVGPVSRDFFVQNYYRRPFEVAKGGGSGPRMVLEAAMAGRKVKLDDLYESYRKRFAKTIDKAVLQDGAMDLLRLLKKKGYSIGIATMRYTRSVVDRELQALGVDSVADLLLTRQDLGFKQALGSLEETIAQRVKIVSKALSKMGLRPEDAFLVGDSWWDIRAGKRVGMKTVLILTGFSSHNDFSAENPDLTVKSLRELESRIRNDTLFN